MSRSKQFSTQGGSKHPKNRLNKNEGEKERRKIAIVIYWGFLYISSFSASN